MTATIAVPDSSTLETHNGAIRPFPRGQRCWAFGANLCCALVHASHKRASRRPRRGRGTHEHQAHDADLPYEEVGHRSSKGS